MAINGWAKRYMAMGYLKSVVKGDKKVALIPCQNKWERERESLSKEIYMIQFHSLCLKRKAHSDYIFTIL